MTDYIVVDTERSEVSIMTDDHECNGWGMHPYDCQEWIDLDEARGQEIDIMSRSFKRQGIGRGEARRLARVWVDTEDLPKGKRKGAAARVHTRRQRQDRLDRRGRCWEKIGAFTGEAYCGRHGRNAGWPCAR